MLLVVDTTGILCADDVVECGEVMDRRLLELLAAVEDIRLSLSFLFCS